MKKFILIISLIFSVNLSPQSFNVSNYKNFLKEHSNMKASELLSLYNAGLFKYEINYDISSAKYLDSVIIKFKLTEDEILLLKKNGFVVTERISFNDFIDMYLDIYHKDLPVLITTDAILNAFHKSYDAILKKVEVEFLIPKLKELLKNMHNSVVDLKNIYESSELDIMIKDVDLYLSVARELLGDNYQLHFYENKNKIDELLNLIENQNIESYSLFSSRSRKIDFSQFKVRGHYDDERFPQLANYFKTMTWLGRTEFYLIAPESEENINYSIIDEQRQIIDSYFLLKLIEISNSINLYEEIENTIKTFVGEQDNVELYQLRELFQELNINSASQLLDTLIIKEFQELLLTKNYSDQKILSQILNSNPLNPEIIKPASAFLLFGQRFVIDSYITNNVTFDRIIFNGKKVLRMLPSLLDIMFALGNSAAAQLLRKELELYNYSSNLASLRYLIDSYDNNFWKNSIYNLWLNAIRTLNPPYERSVYPEFMQTAAWWQQKLNTQLASWTELRHDNLLYAKQSYTGNVICSYPYGFVEPIPEFYSSMKLISAETLSKLNSLSLSDASLKDYFENFSNVMDTLKTLAEKELHKIPFNNFETNFLKRVVYDIPLCGTTLTGWYYDLIYKSQYSNYENKIDFVVADYHTSPSDEAGNVVGWIKHSGTGKRNLIILVAEHPDKGMIAFAGPVNSYYEITTNNFYRITDNDWINNYLKSSSRPDWVNIYLADINGNIKQEGINLITGIKDKNQTYLKIPQEIFIQNFPNPFNNSTVINFVIPSKYGRVYVELNIYTINGEKIKQLLNEELRPGSYFISWDGKSESGLFVSSGTYFYEIKAGQMKKIGKMILMK